MSQPISQGPSRNGSVDILRFVGAIGIVWFHMHLPGFKYGLSALPMFVALFVCFNFKRDVAALNQRLLYPWLVWSAIFALAKIAQALISGRPIADEFEWNMLLIGPSIHLWFLPFSYLFVLVARLMTMKALLGAGVVLIPICVWMANSMTLPAPFAQWVTVVPAAFMGIALQFYRTHALAVLALGWVSVVAAYVLAVCGLGTVALQYAIGVGAVLIAYMIQTRPTGLSDFFAKVSFGVYLIHPLIFASVLYLPISSVSVQLAVVVVGSILATLALRRIAPKIV